MLTLVQISQSYLRYQHCSSAKAQKKMVQLYPKMYDVSTTYSKLEFFPS